jgi:hypothetical protein
MSPKSCVLKIGCQPVALLGDGRTLRGRGPVEGREITEGMPLKEILGLMLLLSHFLCLLAAMR